MAMKTASLVRDVRQQLNLTQEKFAAKLGVSFKTVNRWENGRSTPSPMALKLIQGVLRGLNNSHSEAVRSRSTELLSQYFSEEERSRDG